MKGGKVGLWRNNNNQPMLEEEGIGEPCLGKVFLGDQREDSQSKSMTTASTIVLEEEGCLQR